MKFLDKNILILFLVMITLGAIVSCEDSESVGAPAIHYVRVTTPAQSDSLLAGGFLGNLIVIVGENLSTVKEVWFNDKKATVVPTFVTNTSIIVNIPGSAPTEVTNTMRLTFKNGSLLIYPFEIEIPGPAVSTMLNEYAAVGSKTQITGEYFFDPVSVAFTGGAGAEVTIVNENTLEVTVPAGAEPGPVTVSTNFGEVVSNFWYKDNRFVFGTMDTPTDGWWHGQQYLNVSAAIPLIDNKYVYVDQNLDQGQWFEWYVGNGSGILEATKNIPDDAIKNPSAYNFKFEVATLSPWPVGAVLHAYIGDFMGDDRIGFGGAWTLEDEIDTNGQWQTVTTEFDWIIKANTKIAVNPAGYQLSFWFWEGVPMHANFAIDNLRVSPK